ncbi:hypothetical protein GCM10020358_77560 [Amorphoplanes nipponensis]|uniref:Uncharacterized protein n=1 Tax=Actinoplanes nipponensis TaxID=135950 RepID=A0A919JN73_9ACTN|nr:hypothetical protein [Actinoplanes nipponensis]GIE49884.1 hypothetical protein Ani05nite_34180 [Actinoplanes nipponensis]
MSETGGWVRVERTHRGRDHFLGTTGRPADEFDRLAVTVTSLAELREFLQLLAYDLPTRQLGEGPVEAYLDTLLAWLRSDEGRQRLAAYRNDFAATAATLYAGLPRAGGV